MNTALMKLTMASERPRERCLEAGASCLSLRECLAVILGSGPVGVGCLGLATRILQLAGEGLSEKDEEQAFFADMEVSGGAYLKSVVGLGPSSRAKVLAAFELGRRYTLYRYSYQKAPIQERSLPRVSFQALEKIPAAFRVDPKEWLGFIPHYRTGVIGEFCLVERGVRTHVNVDPAELFARILALRPLGFFLSHNHPSGHLEPSWEDRNLTEKVGRLAQQFGIQLLGHWIVGPQAERFLKFAEDC